MARFVIVGAGLAGAKAAEALRERGLRRPRRADRRRAPPAVRAAAAVEGLPAGRRPSGTTSTCTTPTGTPSTTSTCGTARGRPRSTRPRTTVTLADGSELGYDKLLLATGSRAAQPAAARRRRGRRALPAHARRLRPARRCCWPRPTRVVDHRRRLDRPGGRRRRPGTPASTSPSSRRPSCRCCGCSGPRSRRSSPTCTASTASTSASARRSREITGDGRPGDRRASSPTAPRSRRDAVSSASAPRPTPSSPRRPAWRSTTASWSTRTLRTSDPDIFAAGDVANADHPLLGRRVRVEHWANALNQPAGRRRGDARRRTPPTTELPYFFTDQYDLGHGVRRATPSPAATTRSCSAATRRGREFIAFWLAVTAGCSPG